MELVSHLNVKYSFSKRPQYYSPDLNVERGISILVLILRICCRSNRSSYQRIQVLNWVVKNKSSREEFINFLKSPSILNTVIIRHEPWLNRTIDIAIGEGIVEVSNGKNIALTELGVNFATEIINSKLFIPEREFLMKVKKTATEKKLEELIKLVSDL
ncbi:hypothetical protein [Halobacillus aidingensis]|uniref:Uncharacterized protein n=1 Tax=Halobacillus aidingensis TaxID=240303 RepID=A0A1H0SAB6_HALAD|nr:hypothetical protein [Halobacillus aidingensis]SDP38106.1 hypothetical protein SAMN05421677_11767 [Halobacillus aidingensis]